MSSLSPQSRRSPAPKEAAPVKSASSSFAGLQYKDLEAHLEVFRYGAFELTEAVRPSFDLKVVPRQGFRHEQYSDEESKNKIPVVMASATRERLFDLFIDMLEPLGDVVDVVLESSHSGSGEHTDLLREHIDAPVLKSVLYDFEDLLLNDGCTGIAVMNPRKRQEIQFDEHKLVIAYGTPLESFERILIQHDVYPDKDIRFITEAEHVHSSSDKYTNDFEVLRMRLGIDD
jgi:hypothetical protein